MINHAYVRDLFQEWASGNPDAFFAAVHEDVAWTVMGTHPLAGHYIGKADLFERAFGRLLNVLRNGVAMSVHDVFVDGPVAIAELRSSGIALNGRRYNSQYCWIMRFDSEGRICKLTAYLDSALVNAVLEENE